jgi:mono/diheme cytochrome c family protein
VLATAAVIPGASCPGPARAEAPSYNRDVRAILSSNCFACHGRDADHRQADLRLDEREGALADRDGAGPAVVPGDAEASLLIARITAGDDAERMPPAETGRRLTEKEIATLRAWVEAGAKYERHWAFVRPEKSPPPDPAADSGHRSWPRNEVDRFVLARLEAEGLHPAPEADRRTLIRRLSFDLVGLPPSAEEVATFVQDPDENAYEKLVDRLLASPHYGERMALDWLDAARYSDTNGYSIDGGRTNWLWRDWVIHAFNENMPYDRFLLAQLAGDLLPGASQTDLVATGFQRNNMVTHEGGTIPEENLANYNFDRVKTLGEAVLGLTLGCAQCHDHKYDPISQREYYQLFAYFNTASDVGLDGDRGVTPRPTIEARTCLPDREVADLNREIGAISRELAHPDPEDIAAWEASERDALTRRGIGLELHQAQPLKVSTPNQGEGFDVDGQFVNITKPPELAAYDVSLQLPKIDKAVTGIRVVFHADSPGSSLGYGRLAEDDHQSPAQEAVANGTDGETPSARRDYSPYKFVVTSLSVSADVVPSDQVNLSKLLDCDGATASSWLDNYRPEGVLTPGGRDGWCPDPSQDGPQRVTVHLAEPLDAATTPYATVQVNFGALRTLVARRFEFLAVTGEDDDSHLPAEVVEILRLPAGDRTGSQAERIEKYFAHHAPATQRLRTRLANLKERLAALTEKFPAMVMDVAEHPRETFILERGNYAAPMERVDVGVPAALPRLAAEAPANRLGLAEWVTRSNHPLTWRVAVNRLWQTVFGAGIVRTSADFGTQGEPPTHPELLDWLAVDFAEHGYDVKRTLRLIVTSATYRQSSSADDALAARDPQNRLLARGPRFRLPAELVRDAALKTSGLMVPWIGGPSVNPYAPGDLWREVSHYGSTPATSQSFEQDHGEKLYRRSLYTYWKRTMPPPNMTAFDAPTREVCTAVRSTTTTPMQALVMLNDVQFVEAARAFAERIFRSADKDRERIVWAFEECLSRPPQDEELALVEQTYRREQARYARAPDAARKFLASGESLRDERIPLADHAAWAQVAALVMNLSENITRN